MKEANKPFQILVLSETVVTENENQHANNGRFKCLISIDNMDDAIANGGRRQHMFLSDI